MNSSTETKAVILIRRDCDISEHGRLYGFDFAPENAHEQPPDEFVWTLEVRSAGGGTVLKHPFPSGIGCVGRFTFNSPVMGPVEFVASDLRVRLKIN